MNVMFINIDHQGIIKRRKELHDFTAIKEIIQEADLEEQVLLHNRFVEDDLVEAYYRASDIVLVPYTKGFESGVLKYAFSCERAVVVSDLPEFSEFVWDGENCVVVKAGDARDLAEKMQSVLQDEELVRKIAKNAGELARTQWAWADIARKTTALYERVSAGGRDR